MGGARRARRRRWARAGGTEEAEGPEVEGPDGPGAEGPVGPVAAVEGPGDEAVVTAAGGSRDRGFSRKGRRR
jgi:hypothetical protein